MYLLTRLLILLTFMACNSSPDDDSSLSSSNKQKEIPIEVTGASLLIANAHIFPISSDEIENGYIYVENGIIKEVKAGKPPASLKAKRKYDAKGKYVTPGIIDTHSHLGVYSSLQ